VARAVTGPRAAGVSLVVPQPSAADPTRPPTQSPDNDNGDATAPRRRLVARLGTSRFNYWFGYPVNVTLVAWLASRAFLGGQPPGAGRALLLLAAGLVVWTLAEYLLHRYLYHVLPSFLSVGHALHHASPRALIGVPWYLTTIAALALYAGLARVADPGAIGLLMAGAGLGYVLYCLAHHGSHHWRMRHPWLRRMRRHHLIHHAHPGYNWGFTTSLWDRVFGTLYRDRR
jgi:sterol desaturase/sphingolipid hydroxylase (fatty acid hydroxylase superfamily)